LPVPHVITAGGGRVGRDVSEIHDVVRGAGGSAVVEFHDQRRNHVRRRLHDRAAGEKRDQRGRSRGDAEPGDVDVPMDELGKRIRRPARCSRRSSKSAIGGEARVTSDQYVMGNGWMDSPFCGFP